MESDLAKLIAAARRGEGSSVDTLFARHLPPLVAFIRARAGGAVRAHESALDLAQSVCREVLQDVDRIALRDEGAFRNWLFMAATRKVLNRAKYLHRQRRDVARAEALPADAAEADVVLACYTSIGSPSRHAVAREQLLRVEQAVQALPEDQRDAVMMSRLMDLSYAQIAEQMGRSESAVRGLVARGIAALSVLFEDHQG